MRNLKQSRIVPVLLLMFAMPLIGHASVLTFGPICSGNCVNLVIPDGYGGFIWNGEFWGIGNTIFETEWNNTYGAPSGGAG